MPGAESAMVLSLRLLSHTETRPEAEEVRRANPGAGVLFEWAQASLWMGAFEEKK